MKKFSLSEPKDYLALAARRKWWILAVALIFSTATAVVALMLPSFYESETLILVQPRDIPEDVVRDFVTADTQQRLVAIQETVLSRTNLLRIINEFNDDLDSIRYLSSPDQVERLRSRINIEITTDRQSRITVVPYFRIAYQDRDPEMAQKITARLAALFIEYDTRTRETQVFGTAEFLRNELDKVASQLQSAEQEVARVKRQYQYELPDQLDANLRTLDRLQEQLKTNLESHDRYLALKLDLERQLTQTPEFLSREVQRQRQPGPPPEVQEYLQKSRQLKELKTRYTDRHPDVVRLEGELVTLRQVVSEEDLERALSGDTETSETERDINPVYSQLSSQLSQVEAELKILKESRNWIERQIVLHNERVQNTPVREREIASIQRRYDDLSDEYNGLKVKLSQAELAQSLESRQKGEQFLVVDPASYPLQPSKPNRWLILLGGLVASLALGIGLAVGIDFADQKLWTQAEVEKLLGIPVLTEIPEILPENEQSQTRSRKLLAAGAFLLLCLVAVGVVIYIYLSPELRSAGGDQMVKLLKW